MPRGQKKGKNLLEKGERQLLSLKEVLDQVFGEAKDLPEKVEEPLKEARNEAWKHFSAKQEQTLGSKSNSSEGEDNKEFGFEN